MIAVSWSDYEKSGCVNCGCEYCHGTGIRGGGSTPVKCGECGTVFVILASGLEKSCIGYGDGFPDLQQHPRKGTPKHDYVRPDVRPDEGEYWASRGVGYDLSGFVECKAAGERVVEMVKRVIGKTPKTWLDYRPSEPNWIQVKVQASDGFDLEKLDKLCHEDGVITEERLREALPKYLIKLIGSEDYHADYAPCGTNKEGATRLSKEDAENFIKRSVDRNNGESKVEMVRDD